MHVHVHTVWARGVRRGRAHGRVQVRSRIAELGDLAENELREEVDRLLTSDALRADLVALCDQHAPHADGKRRLHKSRYMEELFEAVAPPAAALVQERLGGVLDQIVQRYIRQMADLSDLVPTLPEISPGRFVDPPPPPRDAFLPLSHVPLGTSQQMAGTVGPVAGVPVAPQSPCPRPHSSRGRAWTGLRHRLGDRGST